MYSSKKKVNGDRHIFPQKNAHGLKD